MTKISQPLVRYVEGENGTDCSLESGTDDVQCCGEHRVDGMNEQCQLP